MPDHVFGVNAKLMQWMKNTRVTIVMVMSSGINSALNNSVPMRHSHCMDGRSLRISLEGLAINARNVILLIHSLLMGGVIIC